ncbi:FMN-binding negative transcriptional regulator [Georgenia alba]|uniref:FMN-binding negative transcriptional regulator n=1 Tax=Georgenia alba TaxID=2233858 RepID=A0ABW2Q3X5_9MICO
MLPTRHYLLEDPEEIRALVRENPWATFVSQTSRGLLASHYPIVLEEEAEGISIVSHVGRPDDKLHELAEGREMMLIVQGPHGYISPSWYGDETNIPTWNHVTAHLYGVPELLDPEENFRVLSELVDRMERGVEQPRSLAMDSDMARAIARGTVGLRLRVTRFDARAKLSQNKTPEVRERIRTALRQPGPYRHDQLAEEMARFDPSVLREGAPGTRA